MLTRNRWTREQQGSWLYRVGVGVGMGMAWAGMAWGNLAAPPRPYPLPSGGPQAPVDRSAGILERGQGQAERGEWAAAIESFTQAVALSPKDPKPLYLRGNVQQRVGQPGKAEADYRAALALNPALVDVKAELAAILLDSKRVEQAEALLREVVQARPTHFAAQANLGVARSALGKPAEAILAYEEARKLKPEDVDVAFNLAVALRKVGRLEDALAVAKRTVQLAPRDGQARLHVGQLLVELKRLDEAATELQAVVQLAPQLMGGWWKLGVVLLKQGKTARAIGLLQTAAGLAKPGAEASEVLDDLGLAQRSGGDLKSAEASFRKALQAAKEHHVARLHLCTTLAAQGRCGEALKEASLLPGTGPFPEQVGKLKKKCGAAP